MHPAGLRCSSLTYARYARSSRLAGRAPRRPAWRTYFRTGPKRRFPGETIRLGSIRELAPQGVGQRRERCRAARGIEIVVDERAGTEISLVVSYPDRVADL